MILVKAKGVVVDRLSSIRESIIRAIWLKPFAGGALLEWRRRKKRKLICLSFHPNVDPLLWRNAFFLVSFVYTKSQICLMCVEGK